MRKKNAKNNIMTRPYGNTGVEVTALGFGGMRFDQPDDIEGCAETVYHAFEQGINYFDTAPGYFDGKSEQAFGLAVQEMKKTGNPFYISTKSMKPDGAELRRELEASLMRMNLDRIDFYNCWCVLTLDDWEVRKKRGAVAEIMKAKEEGLISFPVFSTHLSGDDIRTVIEEGYFRGVTLGYSAVNFPFREAGIRAAAEHDLGVVVMNPLGGGTIVNNEESFQFIKRDEKQNIVEAALHFIWAHDEITVALVGYGNKTHVDAAVAAARAYEPYKKEDVEKIKKNITRDFNRLCTSCTYCDVCPEEIPVWKFVETANHVILKSSENLGLHLKLYWGADPSLMEKCIRCGQCESACTQHIPIMERFELLQEALMEEPAR